MQIISNIDYFKRTETSASDLTACLYDIISRSLPDATQSFKFGTLFHAVLNQPEIVDFGLKRLYKPNEIIQYTSEDFEHALTMKYYLLKNETFIKIMLDETGKKFKDTVTYEVAMIETLNLEHFKTKFTVQARCMYDFWNMIYGADLKSVAAKTETEFENWCTFFGINRQRAWYMDISGAKIDFIFAVSKKNNKVFLKKIVKGDKFYESGKKQNNELAYYYENLKLIDSNYVAKLKNK